MVFPFDSAPEDIGRSLAAVLRLLPRQGSLCLFTYVLRYMPALVDTSTSATFGSGPYGGFTNSTGATYGGAIHGECLAVLEALRYDMADRSLSTVDVWKIVMAVHVQHLANYKLLAAIEAAFDGGAQNDGVQRFQNERRSLVFSSVEGWEPRDGSVMTIEKRNWKRIKDGSHGGYTFDSGPPPRLTRHNEFFRFNGVLWRETWKPLSHRERKELEDSIAAEEAAADA